MAYEKFQILISLNVFQLSDIIAEEALNIKGVQSTVHIISSKVCMLQIWVKTLKDATKMVKMQCGIL